MIVWRKRPGIVLVIVNIDPITHSMSQAFLSLRKTPVVGKHGIVESMAKWYTMKVKQKAQVETNVMANDSIAVECASECSKELR